MCPARARGLEKRREQSLHVVFAMARESLRLSELGELSPGRRKNGEERERERASERAAGEVRI
jgi:hypothetical protein